MSRRKATPEQRARDRAFGLRLAGLRAHRFPTQAELAAALDLSPSTIYRIEAGLTTCRPEVLTAIAQVLRVKPEALTPDPE